MARIDDYAAAVALAAERLSKIPFETLVARSGVTAAGPDRFLIDFLGSRYGVSYPAFSFSPAQEAGAAPPVPLQEQVLLLHYLEADGQAPVGRWITYREIPGASFYFPAFVKRAVDPLKKGFGADVSLLASAAAHLDAAPVPAGDAAFTFQVLPRIPVQLILWEGDAEFPPEANILFDESVGTLLPPEDIAWLAGMLVYKLLGLMRSGK